MNVASRSPRYPFSLSGGDCPLSQEQKGQRSLSDSLESLSLSWEFMNTFEIRAKVARIMEWRELNGQIGRKYIPVVSRGENRGESCGLLSSKVFELSS